MPLERQVTAEIDWQQLVDEAVTGLPRHAPAWTDYNVSDSGIAILESLAWEARTALFRGERSTLEQLRTFVRALGLEPLPQRTAEVIVQLASEDLAWDRRVPTDTQLTAPYSQLVFSTTTAVTLHRGVVDPFVRASGAGTARAIWTDEPPLRVFGDDPQVGSEFELSFEHAIESPLTLYWHTGSADHDRALIRSLQAEAASDPCRSLEDWSVHYGVELTWETWDAAGRWVPAAIGRDETRALSVSGLLELTPAVPHVERDGRYPVRCRIVRGQYDRPPTLKRMLVNAARARHASAAKPGPAEEDVLELGTSTGQAGQKFSFPSNPVTEEDVEVWVLPSAAPPEFGLDAEDAEYRIVGDWDRSGPHDRHALLSAADGLLFLGDGRRGWVPRAGAALMVRYRRGGGPTGNVSSNSLETVAGENPHAVDVIQPYSAYGGARAESVTEFLARGLEERFRLTRAVTLDDFERLVLDAPGLPVARAWAFAEEHPEHPGLEATGCVSIAIIPPKPGSRPLPSAALCGAVAQYLERRRTLTTQVHVVAPDYVDVAVAARLHLAADATARADVVGLAEAAFNDWIHPLHGGADHAGWPAGRDLHRAEVLSVLMSVPGVVAVDQFAFIVNGKRTRCESIQLCSLTLFAPGNHELETLEGELR